MNWTNLLHRTVGLGVLATLLSPAAASAETLEEYAARCDMATGVTVPDFVCDEGTIIPTTDHGVPSSPTYGSGAKCDQPNRLVGTCDSDSRFLVLHNSDDAYVVASCRKQGHGAGQYGDIAVIQHNRNNGATCFYQALGNLDGDVKAPSKGNGADGWTWKSPGGPGSTASIQCAGCHDNGPLMRTPYLAQLEGLDALPGAGDGDWNVQGDPYWFVGDAFENWKTYSVDVGSNACTTCHRMGTSNLGSGGVARDFGIRATAQSESSKNDHSSTSPIWMPPWGILYSGLYAAEAVEFKTCADAWKKGEAMPAGCEITRESGLLDWPDDDGELTANPVAYTFGAWDGSGGKNPDTPDNPRFQLVIDQTASVQIDLISSVDTYLYLIGTNGTTVIDQDDDDGLEYSSRIVKVLAPGTYAVVAATYASDQSGDFQLFADAGRFGPVSQGTWTGSGGRSLSSANPVYRYVADGAGTTDLALISSDTDNYLYLLDSNGVVVDTNDDGGPGYNAAISVDVDVDDSYLVVAATYWTNQNDDHYLTASDGRLEPVTVGEWSSSGGKSATASGNRTYWFTLDSISHVEFNLMTSESNDAYLTLLDAYGQVVAANDDAGGNYNSRIDVQLAPGSYSLVAGTYWPNKSGTFYLSASMGEIWQPVFLPPPWIWSGTWWWL